MAGATVHSSFGGDRPYGRRRRCRRCGLPVGREFSARRPCGLRASSAPGSTAAVWAAARPHAFLRLVHALRNACDPTVARCGRRFACGPAPACTANPLTCEREPRPSRPCARRDAQRTTVVAPPTPTRRAVRAMMITVAPFWVKRVVEPAVVGGVGACAHTHTHLIDASRRIPPPDARRRQRAARSTSAPHGAPPRRSPSHRTVYRGAGAPGMGRMGYQARCRAPSRRPGDRARARGQGLAGRHERIAHRRDLVCAAQPSNRRDPSKLLLVDNTAERR